MSFDLHAKFDLDGSSFEKGLKSAEQKVSASAEKMTGTIEKAFSGNLASGFINTAFGAVGLAAVGNFANEMANRIEEKFKEIKLGSQLLNVDPETFQRVQNVAEKTGTSVETVAMSFEHIADAQEKVQSGGAEGQKLLEQFSQLGISLKDLETSSYQDIFFKIAAGMKDASLSGEKLVALKDILGRGGPGLVPAFREGYDSKAANAGILDESQLADLAKAKQLSGETAGFWKDVANSAGLFVERAKAGLIAQVSWALGVQPERRKSDQDISTDARMQQFRDKDAARAAKQAEADKATETARINEAFEREQAQKEQSQAAKDAIKLQQENTKRQADVAFGKLSPQAKKDFLTSQIGSEGTLADEYDRRFKEGGFSDFTLQREAAGHRARQLDAEQRLTGLSQHGVGGEDNPFRIEDRLARIGGGFAPEGNNMKNLAERTARGVETLVQQGAAGGDSNPLKGS